MRESDTSVREVIQIKRINQPRLSAMTLKDHERREEFVSVSCEGRVNQGLFSELVKQL
jgi:hypothetical protein